jgi:hypothetical protein
MSDRTNRSLEARIGEPLPDAHAKRLRDSSIQHSKRTVANRIEYPDPGTLSESDMYDPRDHALLPSEDGQRKSRRTKKRPNNGAEGDQ